MLCSTCSQDLSESAFYKRSNRPRGFHSSCKDCITESGYAIKWRHENRDKVKTYNKRSYVSNPEPYRTASRKRSARIRKAEGTVTTSEWELVLDIYGHQCAYCGVNTDPLTMDHVIPIARGGTHTADNVVPACKGCNSSKKDRMPWEFGYPRTPYDRMDEMARQLHFRFDY